jgi:uncharacterized protein YecA (UPF0149 family)
MRERDFERAEKILKEGLAVRGVRDKQFIVERLEGLYSESGRTQDLETLQADLQISEVEYDKSGQKTEQAKKVKVGRNEPCPCGSGKKYKKCCGI